MVLWPLERVWGVGFSPVIEAAVDDRVVHGGAHGQPHDGQVDLLNKLLQVEVWFDVGQEEEDVEGKPADGKSAHHDDHHLDHLAEGERAHSPFLMATFVLLPPFPLCTQCSMGGTCFSKPRLRRKTFYMCYEGLGHVSGSESLAPRLAQDLVRNANSWAPPRLTK